MNWIVAHWGYVALAYALVSDIMPFLPTKANGVAEAVLRVLGFLKDKKPVAQ